MNRTKTRKTVDRRDQAATTTGIRWIAAAKWLARGLWELPVVRWFLTMRVHDLSYQDGRWFLTMMAHGLRCPVHTSSPRRSHRCGPIDPGPWLRPLRRPPSWPAHRCSLVEVRRLNVACPTTGWSNVHPERSTRSHHHHNIQGSADDSTTNWSMRSTCTTDAPTTTGTLPCNPTGPKGTRDHKKRGEDTKRWDSSTGIQCGRQGSAATLLPWRVCLHTPRCRALRTAASLRTSGAPQSSRVECNSLAEALFRRS